MKKNRTFQHPFDGVDYGEFTWCFHCERAHRTELWVENNWMCPGEKCHGSAIDAHAWDDKGGFPRCGHPEYPDIPEEGKYYPLY